MTQPFEFGRSIVTRVACLSLALSFVWATTSPAAPPAAGEAAADESARSDLFKLKNDELLKQADATFSKVSDDYLSQLRNLATIEMSLGEIKAQLDTLRPPPEPPAPPTPTPTPPAVKRPSADPAAKEPTKAAPKPTPPPAPETASKTPTLDAAQAKQDLAAKTLKLVQANKAELDRLATGLDACQLATLAFQNALDDVSAYGVEAGLRVKDGSLPAGKIPDALKPEVIDRKKKELSTDHAKRRERAASIHGTEDAVTRQLEEANKGVLVATAELSQALKKLAQDQKKQEMEKAIAGRPPADMLRELAQMVDEGHGLKGTFELNLRRFQARAAEVDTLKKSLEDLKPPAVGDAQGVREEGLDQTATATEELVTFYETRVRTDRRRCMPAYQALLKQGGEFDTDAAVSGEHLLKMQVIADVLKQVRRPGAPRSRPRESSSKAAKAVGDPATAVMAADGGGQGRFPAARQATGRGQDRRRGRRRATGQPQTVAGRVGLRRALGDRGQGDGRPPSRRRVHQGRASPQGEDRRTRRRP